MEELKPCPFCGKDAKIEANGDDYTSYVVCVSCGARGEWFKISPRYSSVERAIEAWNRRVTGWGKLG